MYFHPSVISLTTIFADIFSRSLVSGPPKGRVMMKIAETRNVIASIHNAVVIPYSAIVKPPIDAPMPSASDQPPEPKAFAVSNSSSLQIFGRYAYCAGSKIDLAATIAIARKYTEDKLFNKSNCSTINKTRNAARSEQIINPLRE